MNVYAFGPFRLEPATREFRRGDERVGLPPRVFACLMYLIEHRDRAVGRDELIESLWGGRSASDVQLAQLILQCRRAVDDDGQQQRAIATVPGFGYRWIEAVETPAPASAPAPAAGPVAPPARRMPVRALAFTALLAVLVTATAWWVSRHVSEPGATTQDRILIAPLNVAEADARWLRLGGMDVVIERLARSHAPVLPSETSIALMQGDDAVPRARKAGVRTIVAIDAVKQDGGWQFTATWRNGDGAAHSVRTGDADPIAGMRALADRIGGMLGWPAAGTEAQPVSPAIDATLQQARAALLANEPDRARALLLANPELVANEPLLRQQLADADLRAGRYDEARDALDTLIADGSGDSAFRGRLFVSRGMVAVRKGRSEEAGGFFSQALALPGIEAWPVTLGRAYLGRGVSRTSLQDYAGAQADYAHARERFGNAGDIGSVARVDSNTGALEILRGHPAQAAGYLDRALARFEELGMVQESINTRQLAFVARRMQLDNTGAAAAIDPAWDDRSRIVSPSSMLSTGLYEVEALLVRGRLREAQALLDTLNAKARPAAGAEGERRLLMQAMLQDATGRSADAVQTLAPIPDTPHASADDDSVRAAVSLLRARLARRTGSEDATAKAPAPLAALDTPTPRTPLRLLAAANHAWASDDRDAADAAFAAALRLADEQGVPQTLAAVAGDDVDYLLAIGRPAEAAAVAARLALWVDTDYDCALAQLRAAHAARDRLAWSAALERVQRLAGERAIPTDLASPPR